MSAQPIRIAVIPGDGIGREVTSEVVQLAEVVRRAGMLPATWEELDWGAERYLATGLPMPSGGLEYLKGFNAIQVGAFGDPRVPDFAHARAILLGIRFQLDLFINLRPVRCLDERLNPLKHVPARDIDLVIVRENTEGLYSGAGGSMHTGSPDEVTVQEMLTTRRGVERIVRAAFELARTRKRRKVTLVDKANVLLYAGDLWQRTFGDVAAQYADVAKDHLYADTAAMELVRNPGRFDVVVCDSLLGDILFDLAAVLGGGLGLAPSANVHPGRGGMFEPVHGSAPDLAGQGRANPLAALASFALLLRHVDRGHLADAVDEAIAATVRAGIVTPDLGGTSATAEVGEAVRERTLELLKS
jgi:3-isopropylmalate dehydrogenase